VAIGRTIMLGYLDDAAAESDAVRTATTRFVLGQVGRMPDYLCLGIRLVTSIFGLASVLRHGGPFHRLNEVKRRRQIDRWRDSRWGPCRDLVQFHESLFVFGFYGCRDERR
jgi:hypothetical protein